MLKVFDGKKFRPVGVTISAPSFDKIYPIGSIYISAAATNPKELFGGEWVQIKDRFLLAAGDTYAAGSTGGEATHTLTVNEMPSHYHRETFNYGGGYSRPMCDTKASTNFTENTTQTDGTYKYTTGTFANASASGSTPVYPLITLKTGGGAAHNNMPPYLAVYVWQRIS